VNATTEVTSKIYEDSIKRYNDIFGDEHDNQSPPQPPEVNSPTRKDSPETQNDPSLTTEKNFKQIPEYLRGLRNWVNWALVERGGKLSKIPIDPKTGKPASPTDPSTWGRFEEAIKHCRECENDYTQGIGFVFTKTPLSGIDLDHCRIQKTGHIEPWAMEIVNRFRSYTEISPSGIGLHIIVLGKLPNGVNGCRKGNIEIYSEGRYFTVTGNVLPGTYAEISDRDGLLKEFYEENFYKKSDFIEGKPQAQESKVILLFSDDEIIERAGKAKNGEKFKRLFFDGDISDYPSQSEAEFALATMLDFWTQDPEQKGQILRRSALKREKWDSHKSYLDRTIKSATAIEHFTQKKDEISSPELSFRNLQLPTSLEISNLEIKVEWIVENLIPQESITMFHSTGGLGKSYLCYNLAYSIASNGMFYGLNVKQMNVYYIDFENPLPEIVDRIKKIGGSENMLIWHLTHNPMPVRFDSDDWEIYKTFPPGLFIIDSLRSSHNLDENSSKDAQFITSRIKELRSLGSTILLIHHETKIGGYRGSTAWFDLADHILKFSRVKKIGDDRDTDVEDLTLPLRLGLAGKSRFSGITNIKPMFFKFENQMLVRAEDPDRELLKSIHQVLLQREEHMPPINRQKDLIDLIKQETGVGGSKAAALIKNGEGVYWSSRKDPHRDNRIIYEPIHYEA